MRLTDALSEFKIPALTVLTGFLYFITLCFQLGYSYYFGYPYYFIEITIDSLLTTLSLAMLIGTPILAIIWYYTSDTAPRSNIKLLIAVVGIFSVNYIPVFGFTSPLAVFKEPNAILLSVAIILAFWPPMLAYDFQKRKISGEAKHPILTCALVVIYSVIFSACAGYTSAHGTYSIYYVKNEPETYLVNSFNGRLILVTCGPLVSEYRKIDGAGLSFIKIKNVNTINAIRDCFSLKRYK
jgi:hypothetical protein